MAVVDSIFTHARAAPDKTAVVYNGRALSYRTFAGYITLARRSLARQAVGRDQAAVLCINNTLNAWVVALALRSLGVTTVNGRSIEDVEQLGLGPVSVVTSAVETGVWPGLDGAAAAAGARLIVEPADVYADIKTVDIEPVALHPIPGGHILLTSGTTGVYKKVLWDAAADADLIALNTERAGLTASTVFNVMGFAPWTMASYIWPTQVWTLGGQVLIDQNPWPWRSFEGAAATHAVITPSLLDSVLGAPAETMLRNDLMTLFVVAGALSRAQREAARERLTHRITCIFGATESAHLTYTPIETAEDLRAHRLDAGDHFQVVDDQDAQLPLGRTGVVRIRANRATGYLNDPATTAAFFRRGYFYPGDLGVIGSGGRLALQGRVTEVINVGGRKIGALPIETKLQDALGAEAVCIFSIPGETGEDVHVAIQPGRVIGAAELKAALAAALPPGIAGVRVHTVKSFPRNHMGKIERAKLKALLAPQERPLED